MRANLTLGCLWTRTWQYMLLSNCTPFHGATEDELIEKIFEAKVVFDNPVWENVSADAKSLIKKLLNVRISTASIVHHHIASRELMRFLRVWRSLQSDPATRYTATQVLNHPWVKAGYQPVPPEVYDEFVPQVKAFCQYSPLHRAALVAYAFCMPSKHIRKHSDVYNELNVAHVRGLKYRKRSTLVGSGD